MFNLSRYKKDSNIEKRAIGPKPVKLAEIEESGIRSPMKIGYFISLLKFSDLNSDNESQPC